MVYCTCVAFLSGVMTLHHPGEKAAQSLDFCQAIDSYTNIDGLA
jgi:hypothetical protein